jgi:hypothetical protein
LNVSLQSVPEMKINKGKNKGKWRKEEERKKGRNKKNWSMNTILGI